MREPALIRRSEHPSHRDQKDADKEEPRCKSQSLILPGLDPCERMVFLSKILREVSLRLAQHGLLVLVKTHLRNAREEQRIGCRSSDAWPKADESTENAH